MNELKQLNNLPIHELISNPLKASVRAQHDVSLSVINYIKEIGMDNGQARTLDFNVVRPVISGGKMERRTIPISAPLLGLVPLPSLLIETVSIEFTAAITDYVESNKTVGPASKDKDKDKGNTSSEQDQDAGNPENKDKPAVEMFGRVISHSEHMRKTNSSATYNIKIEAKQQEPTEGWSKINDLLATAAEPLRLDEE